MFPSSVSDEQPKWTVEITDYYFKTLAAYKAALTSALDEEGFASLSTLHDKAHALQRENINVERLPLSTIRRYVRELSEGLWTAFVVFRRTPMQAAVLYILHANDRIVVGVNAVIKSVEEKMSEWEQAQS